MDGDIEIDTGKAITLQNQAISSGDILIWTVFSYPADYLNWLVARPFSAKHNTILRTVLLATTLEELRLKLPPNLQHMPREDNDDDNIVEVWL